MNIADYTKCSDCGSVILKSKAYLCDGILVQIKTIPCGEQKKITCDKTLCQNCKRTAGGYDFCKSCYKKIKE